MEYKKSMPEIEIRKKKSHVHQYKITCSNDIAKCMREIFGEDEIGVYESFFCVYLNRANKTVGWIQISQGGITGTIADPRLIMKSALDCLASGIILAHNHPSGNTTPSQDDITLTKKLCQAAQLFDMQVLDHIILTEDSYYSFADEGLI